eukprot:TRINITY_DN14577_c1_g1_i1.p2 TRINITY_DN14577_c1_g1~~TRINITY_DN14577_c1_g1_i1.p2  ORF type:complete len:116 (-),score=17.25 TRINITY_DN14577_c1_g1_i1:299-646(-)
MDVSPGALQYQTTKQDVFKLSKDMDRDLQTFLESVAMVLRDRPGKTATAAEVGRRVPEEVRAWLQHQNFRMCTVLAYYPMDFQVNRAGRGRYIELRRQPEIRGFYPFCADRVICL